MALVSIILTSYNHEKYLKQSIESVLKQTYQDFELIIVDDASQDASWEIIQAYCDKQKVKAFRSKSNSGGSFCWEIVRSEAKGKYMAVHHSDDVWRPEKLEKQIAFLEANPLYAACFTLVEFIDEAGATYELPDGHVYKDVFNKENRSKEEWLNQFFYRGNCLCHPSLLIRREMYEKYGLVDMTGLAQLPDYMQWVTLCLHEEIFIYQEKLTAFRLRRQKQDNTSADRPDVQIRGQLETYYLYKQYRKIKNQEMFLQVFPDAQQYVKNGKMNTAFALAKISQALGSQPHLLLAMDILFELINHVEEAREIEQLYGYTVKDFVKDSGSCDIFATKRVHKYLYASLYIDYGAGFCEENKISKTVYVCRSGDFYVDYEINAETPIKKLRFDPTESEFLKSNLGEVKVNGEAVVCQPKNRYTGKDGYDLFYTVDPQYEIEYAGTGALAIGIRGKVAYDENVFLTAMNLLQEKNAVEAEKKALEKTLQGIYASRGYRFLQRLYRFRDAIKK
jgi:Glycosyltransferases involved in cell wall biogenesis